MGVAPLPGQGSLFDESPSPKRPLTKNQFISQKQMLAGITRAEATKLWHEHHQAVSPRKKLTGEELKIQQEKSRLGQIASERRNKRRDQRAEKFDRDVDLIHQNLSAKGFSLAKTSDSGSRYYELNGQYVRVSDHEPNEATQRWMDSVGCDDVWSVNQIQRSFDGD
jgi:hypothetical protein